MRPLRVASLEETLRYGRPGLDERGLLPAIAGGFSYNPAQISGLNAWYRADSLSLADGASVTTWADSSGNGFTASSSGTAPTFATNQINGLPAVKFIATGFFNLGSAEAYYLGTPGLTLFAALSVSGGITGDINFASAGGSPIKWRVNASNLPQLLVGSTLVGSGSAGVANNTFALLSVDYANSSGGAWRHYLSGTLNGSGTSTTVASGSGATARLGGAANDFTGLIAEWISYTRVLSATERAQVHSYLQDKYGFSTVSGDYLNTRGPQTASVTQPAMRAATR